MGRSGHNFYYTVEGNSTIRGVGFLIHKRHHVNIISIKRISNRVTILKIGNKRTIKIIQVYTPTSFHLDEEIEVFYYSHFTILCDDFNAKINLMQDGSETCLGSFGSEGRNETEEVLLGFLAPNRLFQMHHFYIKN